ncbi:MAG: enoyl-CoA hydratase/isomerase family protein [Chloroflexi bacterium]|nr:enoyl-CoA hydratase/isomerase family protein [Chloroflexota bacterium]
MPDFDHVLSTTDGPVGIVTLNRPRQLNALAAPLMRDMVAALESHDADPSIRAIVLTGGPSVFAAGADIKELSEATPVDMLMRNTIGLFDRVRNLTKPLIAAVGGYALGGGCELAMLCDIVVAAENARFGQPEINIGLIPGAGGTQRLTRVVGKALAMDMILTGRMLGAEEALQHGLAARVVPQELVVDEAVKLGKELAKRPPLSVRMAKEAITRAWEGRVDDGIEFERKAFYLLFATQDAHEGMQAFIDKRQPTYEGR